MQFQNEEIENVARALTNSLKGSIFPRAVWNAPKETKLPYATITCSGYRSQRQNKQVCDF